MNYSFDQLRRHFDTIKTLSFWNRLFGWKKVNALSFDAYEEFNRLIDLLKNMEEKSREKDLKITSLINESEIIKNTLQERTLNLGKYEQRMVMLEDQIKQLTQNRSEIEKQLAQFKQIEESRRQDYEKSIASVNAVRSGLENDRKQLTDNQLKEKDDRFQQMKNTWQLHEELTSSTIRNICNQHMITYVEEVPFSGKPDNTIMIAGEYIIFDAKSPASDDLSNFPKYIKLQTESVKKYVTQENVKKEVFLVIPSNTAQTLKQFSYNMGDYNVYIITLDALEPIILSLKKIEEYEFAEQLTPDERDNICRIIGKFAHTAKRKIQIDYFFSYQFLEILTKCKIDLPADIMESVTNFEKAEKLNPPQEKRAKQILTGDLIKESEQLALEARAKIMGINED